VTHWQKNSRNELSSPNFFLGRTLNKFGQHASTADEATSSNQIKSNQLVYFVLQHKCWIIAHAKYKKD